MVFTARYIPIFRLFPLQWSITCGIMEMVSIFFQCYTINLGFHANYTPPHPTLQGNSQQIYSSFYITDYMKLQPEVKNPHGRY